MRLFNNVKKTESFINPIFDKKQILNDIFDNRTKDCPGWNFFLISKEVLGLEIKFDTVNCDFLAIYTDVINKEIRSKGNPFSEYKRISESIYQIVREVYITDQYNIDIELNQNYKHIIAGSAKELFIKLRKEIE